jgi:hypothetical protein
MMPKTKLGMWAGSLLVVFLVLFIALIYGMNVSRWAPGTPLSLIVGTLTMIAGIAAFIAGAVSLLRFKDRSAVVILAVIIGFIAVLIVIHEVVEVTIGSP